MSFNPCRREVLGLGVGIAAAGILSACSGEAESLNEGAVLASVDEIPRGKAIPVLVGNVPVMLAHTPEGEFRAFSAICTHQGCKVIPDQDQDDILECPCHRSEFNSYTGEVLKGPAAENLPEFAVEVKDGKIIAV